MPAIVSILMEIFCLFTVSLLIIIFVICMANTTFYLSVCLSIGIKLPTADRIKFQKVLSHPLLTE